jgi:hypothetical protein
MKADYSSRRLVEQGLARREVGVGRACSELFGWDVAAEIMRRRLHLARCKGYICDGLKYNWSSY